MGVLLKADRGVKSGMDTVPAGAGCGTRGGYGKHGNVYYGGTTMLGLDIAIFL